MASLNSLYIKKEVLETLLNVLTKKGEKVIELTVNISDTENQYGQNVSAWVSQTKEQRQAKKERFFVGNGKQFWTDGVSKSETATNEPVADDDLPF